MGTFCLAPKTDQSAAVDDQLWALRMQSLRIIDASIIPTMPLANLNAGVLMIVENSADLMLETPPLLGLSQNRSRTIYLSRVKLGLGVSRKSLMFHLYLIQQNLDKIPEQAGRLCLVCRGLLRPLEKASNP